ncbi:hypothetical protein V5799_013290 [Amblyomma americanum]|uniref:Uncharacterized protein n=1 Tax=Amblyomma americanum TaxID=6943 RepID=A0AAQ4E6C5_AMBAM
MWGKKTATSNRTKTRTAQDERKFCELRDMPQWRAKAQFLPPGVLQGDPRCIVIATLMHMYKASGVQTYDLEILQPQTIESYAATPTNQASSFSIV